jgi:hypothetical protein
MAADVDDKPQLDEIYEIACNTSSLKLSEHTRGAADILIASGWSPSRLGSALLRLHSAYDAAEKPERKHALPIKEWKKILHKEDAARRAHAEQHTRYEQWYRKEMEVLLSRLAAFPTVRDQLTLKAMLKGMGVSRDPITRSELSEARRNDADMLARMRKTVADAPDEAQRKDAQGALDYFARLAEARRNEERREEYDRACAKAIATIRYWLSQHCSACAGTKWQLIPGTLRQSDKPCMVCLGGGYVTLPRGSDERELACYLDSCLAAARQSLRRNLSNMRKARNAE